MCGMYGSVFWYDVGRGHVTIRRRAKGGGDIDAEGVSSVGFHAETRGRAEGRRAQGVAVLTAASKARAPALVGAALDRGAVGLLLKNFCGAT